MNRIRRSQHGIAAWGNSLDRLRCDWVGWAQLKTNSPIWQHKMHRGDTAAKLSLFSFASLALMIAAVTLHAAYQRTGSQLRAEKVDWARLVTPNPDWNIHGDRDPELAQFIRENTSLDIHRSTHLANPAQLDDLCSHPFIYAKDLRWIKDAGQLTNIGEYLRRGGFLCVDACATEAVNPDMEVYLRANSAIFKQMFPEAEIRKLPPTHNIYHCYFNLSRTNVYTSDMGNQTRCANYGLYGVFVRDRMVAVISMYGLECGWPQTPLRTSGCMKFMLNIYMYAMTATSE